MVGRTLQYRLADLLRYVDEQVNGNPASRGPTENVTVVEACSLTWTLECGPHPSLEFRPMSQRPHIDEDAETWVLPVDELAARRKGETTEAGYARTLSMEEFEQILKSETAPN
jgi:hypothetical protein